MNPSTSRLETLRSASAQRVGREEGPPSTNASSSGPTDLRLVRRLAPYEGGTPYTKEELKRRNNLYNLVFLLLQIIGFVAFSMWIYHGGGPKL